MKNKKDNLEHKHTNYGKMAERYFETRLKILNIKPKKIERTWFDYLVNGIKVEIKSCNFSVKQSKNYRGKKIKEHYRSGRFNFTKEESRESQFKENIWVCFILRSHEEFIILGFVRAKELNKKRLVCLSQLRKFNLIPLSQWIEEIRK